MEARFCTQCGQALKPMSEGKKALFCKQCDLVTYDSESMIVTKPRAAYLQSLENPNEQSKPEAESADPVETSSGVQSEGEAVGSQASVSDVGNAEGAVESGEPDVEKASEPMNESIPQPDGTLS